MVPMIAPDGSSADVPVENVHAALQAGAKMAAKMVGPDGSAGYVPFENIGAAKQAGAKLASEVPTQFENERNPANQPGIVRTGLGEVGGLAMGIAGAAGAAIDPMTATRQAVDIAAGDVDRNLAGRSGLYRATAGVGSALGVNAGGMERAAEVGNKRAIIGTALGDAGVTAAMPTVVRGAPDAVSQLRQVSMDRFSQAKTTVESAFPNPAAKLVREAEGLPPKAVSGAEDIYRAAAPTGMNKGFRANVYAAAGDLADIGRKINLAESKGGIINPDARVRATVDAIRDHLDDMYQNERAPQIQRNANLSVDVGKSVDAQRGLEYLESAAPESIRNLATKALGQVQKDGTRAGASPLSVPEADALAQAANQNLKTFERATPEVKMQLQTTNPKVGGLKSLDSELGKNLNQVLTDAGESGLRDYERRFAALSAIRDQLESRMNATELPQEGLMGAAGRVTRPAVKLFTKGGRDAIASASQAATADVNIGRMLQTGFRKLSETSLSTAARRAAPE